MRTKKETMWSSFKRSVIEDMKIISQDVMLMLTAVAPFLLILLLKFVFPLISRFIFLKSGFLLDKYYSLAALTIIALIPVFIGISYAIIVLTENDMKISEDLEERHFYGKTSLYIRIVVVAALSFILLYLGVLIIDPVPGEGWLRTLFAVTLLSVQSSFVFLFIVSLADDISEGYALAKIYGFFLITVPLGLVLHHPWNYLAFFSPLYWISWAWLIPVPAESLLYGAIAAAITSVGIFIFFRHFLKRKTG